ncbi:hypothetical protein [Microseira wollei]|uniref:Uncharacterized protein n=1 Tax=Microseira wollei NIES-4236 TaxID=2530354 RepID=A0AAV3XB09_9CYAN|nr:hypothetical protein [Microseira wollei]GET37905.1 hypothetical protein MiSe_26590 [Microseira wollei NIES-4236]
MSMRPYHIDSQRLDALEEILEILYEKLGEFQRALIVLASEEAKFELKQKIKRDIAPDIRKYEKEYWQILDWNARENFVVSDVEAEKAIVDVVEAVKPIENIPPERYPDPEKLNRLLEELHKIINDPEKTAQAKLKVALPIIPLLASYELEMDTESFLVNVWRGIKSMVRRKA